MTLLLPPALTPRRHVRTRLFGCVRLFLTLIPRRRKNRQIDIRLGGASAGPSALVLVVEPAERLGLDREHMEELLVLTLRGSHLAFAEVPGQQRE